MIDRLEESTADEDGARRFVRWLNIFVALGVLLASVGIFLAPANLGLRLLIIGIGLATLLTSEWQLRRGVVGAVRSLAIGFWLLAAVNAVVFAGVHASGNVIFPFVIALAGWQLGKRWMIAATVATMGFLLALATMEWLGWFVPTPRGPVVGVVSTMLAVIPVIAFLTYAARSSLVASRNRALAISRDLFQFMENVPAGVAYFDKQWRLRNCNGRYAALYATTPTELIGKQVRDFAPTVVQDQLRDAGRKVLKGELLGYRRFHVHPETHAVTWLDAAVTPHVVDGVVVGAYTVLTDVTDKVQADAEIRTLNTELEQRVKKRTHELAKATQELSEAHDDLIRSQAQAGLAAMVASVSHELGTPIGNSMLMTNTFSELARGLERNMRENTLRKSSLNELLKALSEGSELLRRNLDRADKLLKNFRQVSADQASEQRRTFDLAMVVSEVVGSMAPRLRQTSHTVEQDVPDGITMDSLPGPLGQVIINLINNALLHAFEGRENGHIVLKAVRRGTEVCITLEDNGKGMSPEVQQRIFEPFFSTRIGDGGTGLGMSIVRNIIVKTLGGTMEVQSKPGHGSRFDILLPLQAPFYNN